MRKIKAGIIGMGFIGPIHMEGLKRLNFIDVVIAEAGEERAKAAAEQYNVDNYYTNWEDLVNDSEIEVVHICAPNHLHYPIAKKALENGKHVICDKPLSMNIKESEELVKLAEEKGVVNAVTTDMAYYPMVQHAKEMIKDNKIGDINYIQGYYLQDWLSLDTDYNWRVESKFQGKSRVVADIGVHFLHMIQEVTGQKIKKVYADFNTFIKTRKKPVKEVATYSSATNVETTDVPIDTDDQACLMLEFENGLKGIFNGGQVFCGYKNRIGFDIFGTDASLAWNGEEPNKLWIGNRTSPNQVVMKEGGLVNPNCLDLMSFMAGGLQEGYSETWKNLMKRVYTAVIEGKPNNNYPTFRNGLELQKIVEASIESDKTKSWVEVK